MGNAGARKGAKHLREEWMKKSIFSALGTFEMPPHWKTRIMLLMTSTEQLEKLISSSSEEELDKDELEVSSLSESESGACCALGTSGV